MRIYVYIGESCFVDYTRVSVGRASEGKPSSSNPGIASILANGEPLYGESLSNCQPRAEYTDSFSKSYSLNFVVLEVFTTPLEFMLETNN